MDNLNIKDIKKLIQLANSLDKKGLYKEADKIDYVFNYIFKKYSAANTTEKPKYLATHEEKAMGATGWNDAPDNSMFFGDVDGNNLVKYSPTDPNDAREIATRMQAVLTNWNKVVINTWKNSTSGGNERNTPLIRRIQEIIAFAQKPQTGQPTTTSTRTNVRISGPTTQYPIKIGNETGYYYRLSDDKKSYYAIRSSDGKTYGPLTNGLDRVLQAAGQTAAPAATTPAPTAATPAPTATESQAAAPARPANPMKELKEKQQEERRDLRQETRANRR